ncbi:AAR046Cp [Eremothecium gossypii ATCC 10895]|uniref:Putative lipase ATG15 n=1 Tax=Eremothecium gossypii (strain ATCC 10895 / CBS 109.51 / FGSC 9923 / NRRL Y-1056) TaxID=284811 RepID=ATG15_EREGS|nr:AAR046Cp [Eremothecium gossypii ATCC 10895]Q75EN3.1 RecName: Full=Putative lipase ATG15; AltName: Full=Autophagy-related protein 15 [Eremothecium gossypii ATCC 10895]AAS50411.1 AAR046Cp [Eremothecium gossypii ATCC 10895]AEY94697.1 FAAR046Cp [Eremothecium gossypii FDAG1]
MVADFDSGWYEGAGDELGQGARNGVLRERLGGNEKAQVVRSRRKAVAWNVLMVLGLILYVLYSACFAQARQWWRTNGMARGSQAGRFQLVQVHHHGVGAEHATHLVLDVDAEFRKEAAAEYSVFALHGEGQELWPEAGRRRAANPFEYAYALREERATVVRAQQQVPEFMEPYLDFALERPDLAEQIKMDWGYENMFVPNITDKETVISLALMSSNAYVRLPNTGNWRNVTSWNSSVEGDQIHLGWDENGLRAHVFANEDRSVVVLALKGTSSQVLPGSGDDDETSANDKLNDNLLFSCCCARVSYLWTTVCDCYIKSYTCEESCLESELRRKDRYYQAGLDMYKQVLAEFPDASIWLTGHSLGGALASLVARTYGVPAVTFEAPGELLATQRLHLPQPPGLPNQLDTVWHFGHTADPIFMGTCNGASSACSIAGYAMETSCHSGKSCVYDVVNDRGWRVNLLHHRIHTVIDKILDDYDAVAACVPPDICHDCYNWNYVRWRDGTTSPMPSSVASKPTPTPTSPGSPSSTCKGRNWFGYCTEYA